MSANPASSLHGQPASVLVAFLLLEAEDLRASRDTRFGTVEIVVHQSRVVQITRSEKVRFER